MSINYDTLAEKASVERTIQGLASRNIKAVYVEKASETLEMIKAWIPDGASVMNGASVTLKQIGYTELLKSNIHPWNNLHGNILLEEDKQKRHELRRQSVLSDFYLGSVHALAETGQFVVASNTGSQQPHIVFTSPNLIFVVSTKKIVKDLDAAMERLYNHVVPLEIKAMQEKYGVGSAANKIIIFNGENPNSKRSIRMILVGEDLGY